MEGEATGKGISGGRVIEGLRSAHGQVIVALSAVLLFIFMWLPWFGTLHRETETGFPLPARDVTINAWQSFALIDLLLGAVIVVAAGAAALVQMGRARRRQELLALLTLLAGLFASALVLYRVIEPLTTTSRRYGLYLGLAAAVGILVGAALWMRQLGQTAFIDARNQLAEVIATGDRRRQ